MIHFLGEYSFNKHITIVEEFEFDITDEQFDRLMQFCTKNVGQDYALLEVILIPFIDYLTKKQEMVPNYASGDLKQYCAELVMRALGEMKGKELTQNADRVKLRQVYEFVKEKYENGATL